MWPVIRSLIYAVNGSFAIYFLILIVKLFSTIIKNSLNAIVLGPNMNTNKHNPHSVQILQYSLK